MKNTALFLAKSLATMSDKIFSYRSKSSWSDNNFDFKEIRKARQKNGKYKKK